MSSPTMPSRRRFLAGAAGVGALTATGALALPSLADTLLANESTTGNFGTGDGRTAGSGGVDPGLVLVSIQLAGGVDFLNTVVPLGNGRYATVRGDGTLAESDDEGDPTLYRLDDTFSLNSMPHLAQQWTTGDLAIVHGVGWEGSSLSHFDATDMWEKGSPDFGTTTGWLGRAVADLAGTDADALLAISMGGVSPSMYSDGWSPVGLRPDAPLPWSQGFMDDPRALEAAFGSLRTASDDDLWSRARNSQLELRDIGARLGPVVGDPDTRLEQFESEGEDAEIGTLGLELGLVADMINGGIPTRAFHVAQDGYDTHGEQRYSLANLLGELDRSIQHFHAKLGSNANRVVIATWTEFGRRPEWNGQGTEHGTAGVEFVIGPAVRGGHHGEPSPLDRFDRDDNFIITTDFRDYLSGLTMGTLGADPARVVDGGRGPLDLLEV